MTLSSYQEAIDLWHRYPAFTFALRRAIMLFPPDGDSAERERLIMAESIQLGSPETAPEKETVAAGDVSKPASDSCIDSIDAFLNRFLPEDAPDPEAAIQAIDGQEDTLPDPAADPPVSAHEKELQARNLIRNRNYREALAIIQDLNLNNPEKSIYFADQIRFLKKLIINQAKVNN